MYLLPPYRIAISRKMATGYRCTMREGRAKMCSDYKIWIVYDRYVLEYRREKNCICRSYLRGILSGIILAVVLQNGSQERKEWRKIKKETVIPADQGGLR